MDLAPLPADVVPLVPMRNAVLSHRVAARREQLKTIQKELGEEGGGGEELEHLAEAIAKAGMPPDVKRHVDKEFERLKRIGEGSALGIAAAMFEGVDVHLHVPAGAIPKDGPSAGVAMFMALASLFADRSIRPEVAMTGEISLRGLVLPVGGIKEKVLAAQRAGVRCVLLPARNRKDLQDIPPATREALEFVWLERVDDALQAALTGAITPRTLQLA